MRWRWRRIRKMWRRGVEKEEKMKKEMEMEIESVEGKRQRSSPQNFFKNLPMLKSWEFMQWK